MRGVSTGPSEQGNEKEFVVVVSLSLPVSVCPSRETDTVALDYCPDGGGWDGV